MPGLGDLKGRNPRLQNTCPIEVHAHNVSTVPEYFVQHSMDSGEVRPISICGA